MILSLADDVRSTLHMLVQVALEPEDGAEVGDAFKAVIEGMSESYAGGVSWTKLSDGERRALEAIEAQLSD